MKFDENMPLTKQQRMDEPLKSMMGGRGGLKGLQTV
jgi:hypothetical protein